MYAVKSQPSAARLALRKKITIALFGASALVASTAFAQAPSNLIVSGTTYADVGQAAQLKAGSSLAPGTAGGTYTSAIANGQFQNVFQNAGADASFGVTSQVFLQNYSAGTTYQIDPGAVVGSFSSKSELAINVSSDGSALTFMAYNPTQSFSSTGTSGITSVTTGGSNNLGLLDISNSNTPGLIDPTNGVNAQAYRTVTQVSLSSLLSGTSGALSTGSGVSITNTNAYSGNNGRAVVLYNGQYYIVGNAGNSGSGVSGTQLSLLSQNTGVQTITPGASSANSTVVGACSGTYGAAKGYQCGFNNNPSSTTGDKTGKDDNFRGLAVGPNGSLYVSKGSGSNGVNTVFQVSGLSSPSTATIGVAPGFPTSGNTATPFGLWFANSSTLYVAYEGGDKIAGANGALTAQGGLTKYSLVNNSWVADYTITNGLGSFSGAGVGGDAGGTSTFYTDGIRNLTGKVNANGTVTLYAVTSTVTDAGATANWDQGANPDQVVMLTDNLSATTAAPGEQFATVETSAEGTVYRGVALATVPVPTSVWLLGSGLLGLVGVTRRRATRA